MPLGMVFLIRALLFQHKPESAAPSRQLGSYEDGSILSFLYFKSRYCTADSCVGNPMWVVQSVRIEGKPSVYSVLPGLVKAFVLGDGMVSWSRELLS